MPQTDISVYIVVNNDIKMRQGKIAAQVGHIVQKIIEEILYDIYEKGCRQDYCINYMKWKNECTKIILLAGQNDMENMLKNHTHARAFYDDFDGIDKLTVVGFFPGSIKDELNTYKLF